MRFAGTDWTRALLVELSQLKQYYDDRYYIHEHYDDR